MVRWIIIFLVIAIIAAIFGFGGIAAGAEEIAKITGPKAEIAYEATGVVILAQP